MIKKLIKYIFDKEYRFLINGYYGCYKNMADDEYLKRKYKILMKSELNLNNPQTFNEKLQWLKLYDRSSKYTLLVDKYLVRDYVRDILGEEYLIPLIGVWDSPDEIDFDALPSQFVLKCNHNSGLGMCICKDKSNLNIEKVKRELKRGLKQDYYLTGREWPYKDVPRKIICEKFISNESTGDKDLSDYKFMCFNGKVKCSFVCTDRFSEKGLHVTFFDRNWEPMPFKRCYPSCNSILPKPINYEKMLELAEKLSEGIPFVRVDFYESSGNIYFGELTFYPGSGFEAFSPEEWDDILGDWIKLPNLI